MHSRWLAALVLAAATSTAPGAQAQAAPEGLSRMTPETDTSAPPNGPPARLLPSQGIGNGGSESTGARTPPASGYRATPQEALRVAQGQLQMAVVRLQKAEDFSGAEGVRQLAAARDAAEVAMQRIEAAFETLQSEDSEAVQQAIRNARIELQSAKEALAGAQTDTPDAAIQALKDLHRAASEVRDSTELAAQPPTGPASPSPAMD